MGRFISSAISVVKAHQIAELIDAVEQAVLREAVNREVDSAAIGQRHRLRLKIDRDRAWSGSSCARLINCCCVCFVHHNRQQPVLERVVAEDVGKVGADDGLEARAEQRPRRMFARAATAEVVPAHQYLRALDIPAYSGRKSGLGEPSAS